MKNIITCLTCVGLLLLITSCNRRNADRRNANQREAGTSGTVEIRYPGEKDTLRTGETYTIKWEGGADSLSIFLIDSALTSVGASVSISDRVYSIANKGTHEYKVPERLEPGTYKFTIGKSSSAYFKIISPGGQ